MTTRTWRLVVLHRPMFTSDEARDDAELAWERVPGVGETLMIDGTTFELASVEHVEGDYYGVTFRALSDQGDGA